jgi:hypothetical protein
MAEKDMDMRSRRLALVVASLALVSSCRKEEPARPPPPSLFKPAVNTELLMEAIVEPASYTVFDAAVYDNGKPVGAPTTDEEWEHVRNGAITLAEAGNLLMIGPRFKDTNAWMAVSHELVDAGMAAARAAEAKDVDALMSAGGQIYDACVKCHAQYLPKEPSGPSS